MAKNRDFHYIVIVRGSQGRSANMQNDFSAELLINFHTSAIKNSICRRPVTWCYSALIKAAHVNLMDIELGKNITVYNHA